MTLIDVNYTLDFIMNNITHVLNKCTHEVRKLVTRKGP